MEHPALSPNMLVGDLLARFPELAALFVRLRMGCAGCLMARFCTLEAAGAIYGLSSSDLLTKIQTQLGDLQDNAMLND